MIIFRLFLRVLRGQDLQSQRVRQRQRVQAPHKLQQVEKQRPEAPVPRPNIFSHQQGEFWHMHSGGQYNIGMQKLIFYD